MHSILHSAVFFCILNCSISVYEYLLVKSTFAGMWFHLCTCVWQKLTILWCSFILYLGFLSLKCFSWMEVTVVFIWWWYILWSMLTMKLTYSHYSMLAVSLWSSLVWICCINEEFSLETAIAYMYILALPTLPNQ